MDGYVTLHHANFKTGETHREIYVSRSQAFAAYFSEANKCTHVIGTAGAIIPVTESAKDAAIALFGSETKVKEK